MAIVALVVIQYRRPTTIPSNSMQPGDSGDPPPRIVTQPKTTLAHVENDGRHYDLWKGTIYLPAGYTPVDPKVLAEDGYPREIKSSYGLIFVRIVKGRFMMGARDKPGVQDGDDDVTNRPAHRVDVPGYYIQKYEVTNGELAQYLSQSDPAQINGSVSADGWRAWYDQAIRSLGAAQAARHPARQVPWLLAAEFAKKRGGWLPTEAQWEFAARSRSSSRVFIWDAETDAKVATNSLAHLFPLPMADGIPTAEVGIYPEDRTLQGVMDMAGNIREWCRDPWVDYKDMPEGGPTPLTEVPPPAADTKAVVRGGSYNSEVGFRFVTRRGTPLATSEEANDVGFRMVIEDARLVH